MNEWLRTIVRAALAAIPIATIGIATSASLPAQTLQITSPADGAVVNSGQTLTVTVTASGSFQYVGLLGLYPIPNPPVLTLPPFQFAIPIPATVAAGPIGISAIGLVGPNQAVTTDPIFIDIERSDNPQQLLPDLPSLPFDYSGDTGQLSVSGKFVNGSTVDLTYSSKIAYTSDTPAVVTVDGNGLVTAVGPGSANIVISYANMSVKVPVTVPPPMKILPSAVSLYAGQTGEFIAHINADPSIDHSIVWLINPQLGSIDNTGVYTAPFFVASRQGVTVTARSAADPTKSVSAQIWVFPPGVARCEPANGNVECWHASDLHGSGNKWGPKRKLDGNTGRSGSFESNHRD